MLNPTTYPSIVALVVGALFASPTDRLVAVANGRVDEKVIAHHSIRARVVGFEVGDYVHVLLKDTSKGKRSLWVGGLEIGLYLGTHKGRVLRLRTDIVDTRFEESGPIRIERVVWATDGKQDSRAWWRQQRRTHTQEALEAQYQRMLDRESAD